MLLRSSPEFKSQSGLLLQQLSTSAEVADMGPRPHLKSRTLLAQVLAVNLLLVAATALVVTIGIGTEAGFGGRDFLVLGLAMVASLLGNWLLLRRRFQPLDELISAMEEMDVAVPPSRSLARRFDSDEVRRLKLAFGRMIARLEAERRGARRAAIQAQERERRRVAQDLHDEVNQALTAVSLRLQASVEHAPPELRDELLETKRLTGQAMSELLALSRQLRPAVLDDHGLLPALQSQVRDYGEQTGIETSFTLNGAVTALTPEQQLVVYRVTQESLNNVIQHAGARSVDVMLEFGERTRLVVRDDGTGFDPGRSNGGLGLSGMRERALLIGGTLAIRSARGQGTTIELTIPDEASAHAHSGS
jgi:two-component system sensor histidine kinase UhpB